MPVSDEQMNRILANIAEKIPSDCSTGRRIHKGSTIPGVSLNSAEFDISKYEAYRNDIEFVNSVNEQLLADEKVYFEQKYGEKVYNFLLTQRNAYITEVKRIEKEEQLKSCPKQTNQTRYCPKDVSGMDLSGTDLSGCIPYNKSDASKSSQKQLFNFLEKNFPLQNADTTFKKIEYRDESHEMLSSTNKIITIVYFCVLAAMFLFLAISHKLFLRERAIVYLFLIVLPFLFPFLFDMLKKLYYAVVPANPSYGPRNAFLENRDTLLMQQEISEKQQKLASFMDDGT